MKNKAIIYPITDRTIFLVDFLKYKYNVIPVEASGSGYCGKDLGYITGKSPVGIKVRNDLDNLISHSESLIITNDFSNIKNHLDLYKQILKKKNKSLNIVMSHELSKILEPIEKTEVLFEKSYYKRIETPIIAVGGFIDDYVNTEIVINLYMRLREEYSVAAVIKESEAEIIGLDYWNPIIYDVHKSENEKILYFNNKIHDLEEKKTPDIIIIQIPGGLMRINEKWNNDFGIYYYFISQAMGIDFFICSVLNEFNNNLLLQKVNDNIAGKYNINLDIINISNKIVDWDTEDYKNELSFCYQDIRMMDNNFPKNDFCFVNVKRNEKDYDKILAKLKNMLEENDSE